MFAARSSTLLITSSTSVNSVVNAKTPAENYDLISELLISFLKYSWFFVGKELKRSGPEMPDSRLKDISTSIFTPQKKEIFINQQGALLASIANRFEAFNPARNGFQEEIAIRYEQREWLKANGISINGNCIESFFGNAVLQQYISGFINKRYRESIRELLKEIYKLAGSIASSRLSVNAPAGDRVLADILFEINFFNKFNIDILNLDLSRKVNPATFRSFSAQVAGFQLALVKMFNVCCERKIKSLYAEIEAGKEKSAELQSVRDQLSNTQNSLTELQARFDTQAMPNWLADAESLIESELEQELQAMKGSLATVSEKAYTSGLRLQDSESELSAVIARNNELMDAKDVALKAATAKLQVYENTVAAMKVGASLVTCAGLGYLLFKGYTPASVVNQLGDTVSAALKRR